MRGPSSKMKISVGLPRGCPPSQSGPGPPPLLLHQPFWAWTTSSTHRMISTHSNVLLVPLQPSCSIPWTTSPSGSSHPPGGSLLYLQLNSAKTPVPLPWTPQSMTWNDSPSTKLPKLAAVAKSLQSCQTLWDPSLESY